MSHEDDEESVLHLNLKSENFPLMPVTQISMVNEGAFYIESNQ